jgi:hypothetical protein
MTVIQSHLHNSVFNGCFNISGAALSGEKMHNLSAPVGIGPPAVMSVAGGMPLVEFFRRMPFIPARRMPISFNNKLPF